MKKNTSRRKGFTLIELLVVITIIGVLASLAVPAISGALKTANQTKDVNNIRQLGIALFTDASDNNGLFRTSEANVPSDREADVKKIFEAMIEEGTLTDVNVLMGNGDIPPTVDGDLTDPGAVTLTSDNVGFSYLVGLKTTSPGGLPLLVTKGALDAALTSGADVGAALEINADDNPWTSDGVAVYRVGGNAAWVKAKNKTIDKGKFGTGTIPTRGAGGVAPALATPSGS